MSNFKFFYTNLKKSALKEKVTKEKLKRKKDKKKGEIMLLSDLFMIRLALIVLIRIDFLLIRHLLDMLKNDYLNKIRRPWYSLMHFLIDVIVGIYFLCHRFKSFLPVFI